MRLKQIKLAGFKSFVDSTTVPFPDQMTAIVGPNGCGKSNVIDAVRWVLGESSAKNLRGDAMTDVIFNGSTNRKPVSQASVELVFDNAEGKLQGQLANRNEISVKRQVNKEAQSTYFLNGSKCRRRDITDIFLGTGLGPRSYAIIEQGMISRLIESKPQELRIFIEEAAGISKYKERRKETETRIKHTRENLTRLEDVREELGTQLDKLKRQAATARRYKELKTSERKYKAELYALKWYKYNEQLNLFDRERLAKETELEAFVAEQRGGELGLVKLKQQQQELSEQVNLAQQKVYQVGTHITRIEQQIVYTQEKLDNQHEEYQALSQSIEEANDHLMMEQERLETLIEQLDSIEPELDLISEQLEQSQQQLLEAEDKYDAWQQEWTRLQKVVSGANQSEQVVQTQLQNAQTNHDRLQQQQQVLRDELEFLAQQQQDVDVNSLLENFTQAEQQLAEAQATLIRINEELSETEQVYLDKKLNTEQIAQNKTQKVLRLESLKQWQQELTAGSDENVEKRLLQHGITNEQHVLTQIKAQPNWHKAVENVLAKHGNAFIVEQLPEHDIQLNLITPMELEVRANSVASIINSGTFPAWFNQVALANSVEEAKQILTNDEGWHSALCITGEWVGQNWLVSSIAQSENSNVLEKMAQIELLEAEVTILTQQHEQAVEQQQIAFEQLESVKIRLKTETAAFDEIKQQVNKLSVEIKLEQQQLTHITEQHNKLTNQQQEIEQELTLVLMQQEELQMELEVKSEQGLEFEEQLTNLESQKSNLLELVASHKHQVDNFRNRQHQFIVQQQNVNTQMDSVKTNLQRSTQHLSQLQQKQKELEQQFESGVSPVEELKLELEELLENRLESEEVLSQKQTELAEVADKVTQLEQGQSGIISKLDAMKAEIESIKLDSEGARIRAQNMLETLNDMDQPIKPVLEAMPSEANEEEWGEKLEKTTQAIGRLGAINLAAIDEYDIQAERKQYLDEQYHDLSDALETLENAIRKIDRESRAKFKETYDRVNSGLQELFPKVFGGGSAYLELTADDLLETGVTIMARPPGKKNSTIHLLSGGEKALTALSLVFSIFRLNPAPFCMLDEVDAPLDDANVGRFCKLVSEMSSTVQFIYISHNKVAMEMATHLTGVTMQEPGVSRLVAVDVQEAVKMAEVS